jgi:tRNA(Leu) C34 or U34 (ribose-2'-O)-methylase TrmL
VLDDAEYNARLHLPPAPQIVFPHVDGNFILGDGAKERVDATTVIDLLWPVISESRRRRISAVVAKRSYSFLPVLEGTYDCGNISAVARSADAMGLGAMHIVATEGMLFKRSRRTSKGADKWSDLWRWRADTSGALAKLKENGYRILVARPSERARTASETDLGGPRLVAPPTAIVFGNELAGVSQEAMDAADGEITVPMAGFSESLNVSVAASLVMAEAFRQRGGEGDLPPDQVRLLTASYLLRAVQGRDMNWLLWLNPEQHREEEEARKELLAAPPGWRRKLLDKRKARAAAASTAAAAVSISSGEEEDDSEKPSDGLSAEESAKVEAAIEELRRRGGVEVGAAAP